MIDFLVRCLARVCVRRGRYARGRARRPVLVLLLCGLCLPAWSVSGAAQPAGLVLKSSDQSLWVDGLKSIAIGSLALTAAAASLFWLRRRYSGNLGVGATQWAPLLKSSRRISQKTVLLVVQWEDKVYLLAEHGQTTQLLDSRSVAGNRADHCTDKRTDNHTLESDV